MLQCAFRRIPAAALVALFAAYGGSADAAFFGFHFNNENGLVAGTVSGEIMLPDGDGTFAATSLLVTSAPAALGYGLPLDVLAGSVLSNQFTVSGGAILGSNFIAVDDSYGFTISTADLFAFNSDLTPFGNVVAGFGVSDQDSSSLVFTVIPLPASLLLLSSALAGLGVVRRFGRA